MASNKLKGITIEIGGDTTNLQKAISEVDKKSRALQSELKEINSALKFDPDNVELLAQKQEVLTKAVEATEEKLKTLRDAEESVQKQWEKGDIGDEQFRAFQREIITTESRLKKYQETTEKAEKAQDDLSYSSETLSEKVSRQRTELKELKGKYADVTAAQGKNSNEAKDLSKQIAALSGNLSHNESELANAEKSADKYDQTLGDTEDSAKDADKAVDDLSDSAKKSGEGFSTAAVAVGTFMGNLAADVLEEAVELIGDLVSSVAEVGISFESAFAGVKKTVNGTDEEIANLRTDIIDMSKEMPTTADEIAEIAEAAGQLGIETDVIASFTEVMANLGVSTNLSSTEAASSLAKFANVVRMSADDYDELGSTIVALGNNYATTEADIVSMATRLASTGEIVGLSEPQIMAIATSLSSVGIEAEAGGSAISKLLKQMETSVQTYGAANEVIGKTGYSLRELELMASHNGPAFKGLASDLGLTTTELKGYMENAKSLEQFADVAGMSADQFIAAWGDDAVGALSSFIGGLNDTENTGKSAVELLNEMGLTEVRLSNVVLSLASSDGILNDALSTANQAWEENTALTNEAAQRYETLESQLQILNNNADALSITMYDKVRGSMGDVVKTANEELMPALEGMLNGVEGSEEQLSDALVSIATDVLDTIVGALPDVMSVVGSVLGALGTAIGEVAPELIDMVTDLVVDLVDALADGAPEMREGATELLASILDALEEIVPALLEALPVLITEICTFLVDAVPMLVETAVTLFMGIVDAIPTIITELGLQLPTIITTVVDSLTGAIPLILSAATGALTAIVDAIPVIIPPLLAALPDIIDSLISALVGAIPLILDAAIDLLMAVVDAIPEIIPPLVEAIPEIIDSLISGLLEAIPELLEGAISLLMAIVDAIPEILPPLMETIPDIISSITTTLLENIPELLDCAVELFMAIVEAIPEFIPLLVEAIPLILDAITSPLTAGNTDVFDTAMEVLSEIVGVIPEVAADIKNKVPEIITKITDGLSEGIENVKQVGKDLLEGLWNGIEDKATWLKDQICGLGEDLLGWFDDIFDINSPSKEMEWRGEMLDEGVAKGITKHADEPLDALAAMSDALTDEADELSGITLERRLNATFGAQDMQASESVSLLTKLDSILYAIERGQILLLDGDALVGGTASKYDRNLGEKEILIERGAL